MNLRPLLLTAAFVSVGLTFGAAHAQVAADTTELPVTITIQNACVVSADATGLDFGTRGVLNTNFDSTSIISVICTKEAEFNISLDGGENNDTGARYMINGDDYVGYQLYTDGGFSDIWGEIIGTDSVEGVGTGFLEEFTVYGRVPPQDTPPAKTYSDLIGVTVTYGL